MIVGDEVFILFIPAFQKLKIQKKSKKNFKTYNGLIFVMQEFLMVPFDIPYNTI